MPQIEKNIRTVLQHGKYIMGPEVEILEKRLAEFAHVRHAVTCASGTDALLMALMANGIGPGDAVFTTPFTFIATAEVISLLGATPVFVDIDAATFNLSPEKLETAIQQVAQAGKLTPKAIIPVDLFGLPCDYDRINKTASDHHLAVIEDAAQSFGAEYKGKMAGSLAHAGCTSFFPAKPLGCYGDGGAVLTDSDDLAENLKSIRIHGKGKDKYDNIRLGINGRLDTLQAAVLLPKLDIFPHELVSRRQIARNYTDLLSSQKPPLTLPREFPGIKSAWAQYSILATDAQARQAIQDRLQKNSIPTAVYYPTPLHLQSAFAHLRNKKGDFPVSEDCAERIFSIPMHPYLTDVDLNRIFSVLFCNRTATDAAH
ncbi:MAG: DegT/DnrJ/EryC1/StrS family aminotransferase [Desulfobacteraceae bacterium]|nr:DegT/DnrJ/EryC1/StrS family aminotransferase [Desulfobacteraceae bacterium]